VQTTAAATPTQPLISKGGSLFPSSPGPDTAYPKYAYRERKYESRKETSDSEKYRFRQTVTVLTFAGRRKS